ncbi:MAG: hypothetical protein K0S32_1537 [Bacteroidetes bacterium]|jgi:hypothetical protein|nr:hypothetical protein [Bacteroidota bacterium]
MYINAVIRILFFLYLFIASGNIFSQTVTTSTTTQNTSTVSVTPGSTAQATPSTVVTTTTAPTVTTAPTATTTSSTASTVSTPSAAPSTTTTQQNSTVTTTSTTPTKRRIGTEMYDSVEVNLMYGTIPKKYIPFDVPFRLTGSIDTTIMEIEVSYVDVSDLSCKQCIPCSCDPVASNAKAETTKDTSKKGEEVNDEGLPKCKKICPWQRHYFNNKGTRFSIGIPALKPNREYAFFFSFKRKLLPSEKKYLISKARETIVATAFTLSSNSDNNPKSLDSYMRSAEDKLWGITKAFLSTVNKSITDNDRKNSIFSNDNDLFEECASVSVIKGKFDEQFKEISYFSSKDRPKFDDLKSVLESTKVLEILSTAEATTGVNSQLIADSKTLKSFSARSSDKSKLAEEVKIATMSVPMYTAAVKNQIQFVLLPHSWADTVSYKVYLTTAIENMDFFQRFQVGINLLLSDDRALGILQRKGVEKTDLEKMSKSLSLAQAILEGNVASLRKINRISDDINNFSRQNVFCTDDIIQFSIGVNTATSAEFVSRAEWYITGDVGLAYIAYNNLFDKGARFGDIQPFYGLNINVRPVNRQRSYNLGKKNFYWSKLFSIIVGLTYNPQANASEGRIDLFKKNSLVTGFGFHITDQVRFNVGGIWTKFTPSNPLTGTRNELSFSPFVSLSIDLDVYDWLRTAYSELFPKYEVK